MSSINVVSSAAQVHSWNHIAIVKTLTSAAHYKKEYYLSVDRTSAVFARMIYRAPPDKYVYRSYQGNDEESPSDEWGINSSALRCKAPHIALTVDDVCVVLHGLRISNIFYFRIALLNPTSRCQLFHEFHQNEKWAPANMSEFTVDVKCISIAWLTAVTQYKWCVLVIHSMDGGSWPLIRYAGDSFTVHGGRLQWISIGWRANREKSFQS